MKIHKSVKRYDVHRLDRAQRLDNGFLRAPVRATRVGVFAYRNPDGTVRREFRPPDEVFRPDSMESLGGVPVTNHHPVELVDAMNAKKYMVGYTSDAVRRDDPFVATSITITDAQTINAVVDDGREEVSCGYTCDVEHTPGIWNGIRYDVVQRNIKYNHLALVDKGRAGPDVRIKMDAHDAELIEFVDDGADAPRFDNINGNMEVSPMAKVTIDGVEFEASEALACAVVGHVKSLNDAITKVRADHDDMKAKLDAASVRCDELQGKFDAVSAEKTKLETERMDAAEINRRVAARRKIEDVARIHLDAADGEKIAAMDDRDLKVAVIKADCADFTADGKSDAYIDARFDHVAETKKSTKTTTKLDGALGDVEKSRGQSETKSPDEVRAANMRADADAWKQPLTTSRVAE